MISSSYDFAGSTVAISAEEREHFAGLHAFLASLAVAVTDNPAFRIVVQIAQSPALPPDAAILHTGPVWDEPIAIYAVQRERRLLLVPEKALLVVDPEGGTAILTVTRNAISSVTGLCGMHAIDAAVEATGQMPLHGAALTLPDRSAGVLLHAASGAGKTTTTLQLGFDGFGVFTDDIAVVRQDRSGPQIWGLPRDFKIHKNTACLSSRFASLASGNWDRNGEQPINREALVNAGVRVEPAQPVPLLAFVHLVRNEATAKYRQILSSVREVGIVEPPQVVPTPAGPLKFLLVAGHLRIEALKDLGKSDVVCLVATDDEAFTSNKYVSRLATVQEIKMMRKAIDRGVAPERIASALDVDTLRVKLKLLDGICSEAIALLKDRQIPAATFSILQKMAPLRQIEVAEFMVLMNDYTPRWAKSC